MNNKTAVLIRDLILPIVTGFHPLEANHTYYALTQQWPTGSGATSTLLGCLCLRTLGTETSFCQPGSFLSSIHAVLSVLLHIFYST